MSSRVRKGDMVAVISGNDRGKRGRVLRLMPKEDRVIIEGVNLVFKHMRRSQSNPQGGRIRREAAVHISNVMPIDPETNKPTRVSTKLVEGKRIRVARRTGVEIGAAHVAPSKARKGED